MFSKHKVAVDAPATGAVPTAEAGENDAAAQVVEKKRRKTMTFGAMSSFAHDEGVSILIDEPAVEPAHREPAATVARRDVEAYLAMTVANQILIIRLMSTSYDPVTA